MDELRQLLLEKGRVGKVLEILRHSGQPDPATDPSRALLYGHALCLFGDYQQALRVYSTILPDPTFDAERFWGTATALLRFGDVNKAKSLLDDSMVRNPPDWLAPRIYQALVTCHVFKGQFEEALIAIDKGIEVAQKGSHLIVQFILEANRGTIKLVQGASEEAVFLLQRAVKQLLIRDSILSAASFLMNLCSALKALGEIGEAEKILKQAEGLIIESGSKDRLIFLRQIEGELSYRQGLFEKAEQAYEEALGFLQEFPNPMLEAQIACDLSHVFFKKGSIGAALNLVNKTLDLVKSKELRSVEDLCLRCKGKILLLSGATAEGVAVLTQAFELAESLKKWNTYSYSALYLSLGYEELHQRDSALIWLEKCFEVAGRYRLLPGLLDEKEALTPVLLKLGPELSPTEFTTRILIQLRHPVLLKRLLKLSPEGKTFFLRSLSIHDVHHFRVPLLKLTKDSSNEVRHTSHLILNAWQQHAKYRAYTFGTMRVFQEGRMLSHKDWILPGVKRLFLFFATHPDEWHTTDSLLETLWTKPHPKRTLKVLNNLFSYLRSVFEPWHLQGMDYVFFQSQRGAYGFFPGRRFWFDSQAFQEAAKRAEKTYLSKNIKETKKAYRETLDLYQGDYLKEFPYEDWLNQTRDYLREVYFRSVLRYAIMERESGDLSESRRVLEDALFKDPSRSGCAAMLIQVLIQMKLSQEARDWGQRHINFMKKELKEKPAPEVVEALSRLEMRPDNPSDNK